MEGTWRKELCRRYWDEVWTGKDVAASESYLTEDVVLHVSGAEFSGRAMLAATLPGQWFEPFTDLTVTIDQQVEEGDRVVESLVLRGTHCGIAFHPGLFRARGLPAVPARGLPIEFTQISICRLEGSRIAEFSEDFDRVRLYLQLGVGLVVPAG